MTTIRGIYKLPAIKHTFFIISSLQDFSGNSQLRESKKRMGYFAKVLRSKDKEYPKVTQKWKLIVIEQQEFLKVLECSLPKRKSSSSQSCYNPEDLELLAINLLKTPEPFLTHDTPKVLSCVSDEDIIEIFI